MEFIDLTGKKFHRLMIIGINRRPCPGEYYWDCVCDCGNRCVVSGRALRSGNTKSCGCRKNETMKELPMRTTKHGKAGTRIYRQYKSMLNRCSNPNNKDYSLYGGRGIKVCYRWRRSHGFLNFLHDMGETPKGKTLDRKDNNGDYSPRNCRWATLMEQAQNKRNTRLITWNRRTLCLTDWARLAGKQAHWLYKRLKRLPLNKALEPCLKKELD